MILTWYAGWVAAHRYRILGVSDPAFERDKLAINNGVAIALGAKG